jgi:imidazolonepropionase-like amidohydrolase
MPARFEARRMLAEADRPPSSSREKLLLCPLRSLKPLIMHRAFAITLSILAALLFCAAAPDDSSMSPYPDRPIVIATSRMLDGRGHLLPATRIIVRDSKIVALDPKASPIDYDLTGLTVMPGWIDSHVHITWSFGPDGRNEGPDMTTQFAAYQSAANAYATLMAGFTTVQSVGSPADLPLRQAIAQGTFPGPRILTALQPLVGEGDKTGTPDQIRDFVRKQKAAGADLIKIFASESIRKGGGMTLSQDQLNAACGEANKLG